MKKIMTLISLLLLSLAVITSSYAAKQGSHIKFKKKVINDTKGFGIEAFQVLIPEGWRFEGSLSWDFTKEIPGSRSGVQISSPDGRSVWEKLPDTYDFYWSTDLYERQAMSAGGSEILPPMEPAEFIVDVFMSDFRSGITNLRVISSTPLPERARRIAREDQHLWNITKQISPSAMDYKWSAQAANVMVEYIQGGKQIIEGFTVTIVYYSSYRYDMNMGQVTSIGWGAVGICFRAPASEMKKKAKLFKIISDSYKWNPKWTIAEAKYVATILEQKTRQQQANYNRIMKAIKSQSDIADMQWESMKKRSEAEDRMFDKFDQTLRGVDTYSDPFDSSKVELPSGYENIWTDGTNYIFSDDANFDPNVGSSQNWEQMKRQ